MSLFFVVGFLGLTFEVSFLNALMAGWGTYLHDLVDSGVLVQEEGQLHISFL